MKGQPAQPEQPQCWNGPLTDRGDPVDFLGLQPLLVLAVFVSIEFQ